MNLRETPREYRELPLASLDRPALDARITRNDEQLEDLAGDIARRGVILPLAVVRTGERYEIIDGFCRFIASMRAGLVVVPCVIYPSKDTALEGVKYAANLFRQEMSPAEEAVFFRELITNECGGDIELLCTLVNKKLAYVDNRLALLTGDAEIFEAVRAGQISLGVAAELNTIPAEDYRRYYLAHAVRDGSTVATVRGWVMQWKAMYGADRPARSMCTIATSAARATRVSFPSSSPSTTTVDSPRWTRCSRRFTAATAHRRRRAHMAPGTRRMLRHDSATSRAPRRVSRRPRPAVPIRQTEADRIAEGKRRERAKLKRRLRVVKEIARLARTLQTATLHADAALLELARVIAKRDLNEDLDVALSTGTKG